MQEAAPTDEDTVHRITITVRCSHSISINCFNYCTLCVWPNSVNSEWPTYVFLNPKHQHPFSWHKVLTVLCSNQVNESDEVTDCGINKQHMSNGSVSFYHLVQSFRTSFNRKQFNWNQLILINSMLWRRTFKIIISKVFDAIANGERANVKSTKSCCDLELSWKAETNFWSMRMSSLYDHHSCDWARSFAFSSSPFSMFDYYLYLFLLFKWINFIFHFANT